VFGEEVSRDGSGMSRQELNLVKTECGSGTRRDTSCAGTTLMELLVVLFIVSLLLGIGVGVFGKFTLVNAAENAAAGIRAMVRVIRTYARNHGTVGTIVLDVKQNRVVGLMERVVGQWHFESEEEGGIRGAFDHDPVLGGAAELHPEGCIGGALRLDGVAGSEAVLGESVTFESDWGVSLTADVFLEEACTGGIVAKGEAYGIRVENDGSLAGWVGVFDGEQSLRPAVIDVFSGDARVPIGRWVKVGLFYDRVQVRLFLDYRQVADTQEQRPLARDRDQPLLVGGAAGPIKGRVDSVRLCVLGPWEGGEMSADVKVKGGTGVIRFNPDGYLDPRYHRVPARIVLESEDGTTRTLVIGLMGNVGME